MKMSTSRCPPALRQGLCRCLAGAALLALLTGCDRGDAKAVKQGQVLFVIQQDEYKAALQSARAQLAKADADLTRAKDVSVIDRARAQLDQAKAELGKNQADVAR